MSRCAEASFSLTGVDGAGCVGGVGGKGVHLLGVSAGKFRQKLTGGLTQYMEGAAGLGPTQEATD